jgi:4-hydroxyphenylpyruvate dioxygenase-like putative hemolysin
VQHIALNTQDIISAVSQYQVIMWFSLF